MSAQVFEFGFFRLDADKHVLWRDGHVVPLPPKALALLQTLVEAGGDVVPKPDLMARVWSDTAVQEANLSVTVSMLRRTLGTQEDGSSWIETVPRPGYRFDGPVKGPATPAVVTLAVLPFEVLGEGAEPHVGLGLADALISRLTGLEGLRARPTGAVTHLSGQRVEPRQAAADLGVDAVLAGTVRPAGESVRLSLHLVPRRADLQPWAVLSLGLGERARALDELEQAADERDPWIVFLRADTALLELHGEPRFDALVARVHGRG